VEVREQYQIKTSYSNDIEDINTERENSKENIKTSAQDSLGLYERTQHKPWFDEECSQFLDQTKQAKIQWLQDTNQSSIDNTNIFDVKLVDISGGKKKTGGI